MRSITCISEAVKNPVSHFSPLKIGVSALTAIDVQIVGSTLSWDVGITTDAARQV